MTAPLTDAQVAALREAAEKIVAMEVQWHVPWHVRATAMTEDVRIEVYEYVHAVSPDVVLALLAERDALKRQVTFLKGELSQLANFNPDWDMLQATRESLQEHQARLREISYLLSDAGVGAGTLREGVISLRERSEAAEASLARVQSAAQTIVRGSDLRVLEATAHEPEARVAIATLDSERAMNAQLTAELEAAEAALSALRARETGLREAMHAIYKGLSSEKDGEFWTAQKWCDDHGIYVDNLQGLRVLEEIVRVVLSEGAK